MPIPFTCPHCGHQTSVADQYAGQTGPCARCGKTITVPPMAGAPAYVPPARSTSGPALVIVIVVAAIGAFFVCSGILVALLLPAVQSAREAARRAQCTNNLKQIGLALHNYHDTFGCFPPAYIPDEDGRPKHSWRVLILPYLEQKPLYDQYNFDEPWDSPDNLALADFMPPVYVCPSHAGPGTSETCYAMIVGPETVSDGPTARTFARITDGFSSTIAVIEAAGSGINWMEPRDLPAAEISFQINNQAEAAGPRSDHPRGANVLLCDGSVRFLAESFPAEQLRAMATVSGGEVVEF